jgi:hypothetical protein
MTQKMKRKELNATRRPGVLKQGMHSVYRNGRWVTRVKRGKVEGEREPPLSITITLQKERATIQGKGRSSNQRVYNNEAD